MTDALILCYHGLSDGWPSPLGVRVADFERQLALVLERGYHPVTFADALTAPPAGRVVAVTFDDAYRSVIERAFPILERAGAVGTVFVPTDYVGREEPMSWPGIEQWADGPHRGELVCMSQGELRHLAEAGWEIGSHTCSHPRLTGLDDESLAHELHASRIVCEEMLERPCRTLAYPFGESDVRLAEFARAAGYVLAGTLPFRLRASSLLLVPRIGVYRGDSDRDFRLKISVGLRHVRAFLSMSRRSRMVGPD